MMQNRCWYQRDRSLVTLATLVSLAAGLGFPSWLSPALAESPDDTALPEVWQPANDDEQDLIWRFVLQSPMGIAALNQLAIEGFITPQCEKTLYTHADYETFQTLMQVTCPTARGVSPARGYDEVRVTLNRFEDTIMDFSVERIYED